MLIDVGLPAICVILPPAPSLLQEDSSDACVSIDALASAAERLRSNGLTGMYGPPPCRKRKMKLTGWSAQMYSAFNGAQDSGP